MRSVGVLAIALWLGVMGFFAFVVAPAAFGTLDRDAAGRFVSAVFPRYYLVGTALGVLALAALLTAWWLPGSRPRDGLSALLVLLMVVFTLYAWLAVLPAAQSARSALRAGSPVESARFARLHRLSTLLNGAVMLAGAVFLVLQEVRRP
jgi:hypothetical protein